MAGIVKKGFSSADEVRTPSKTRVEVVDLGGIKAARMTFEPGWRWSECIKPVAGTASCQTHHVGTVVSGSMHVVHDDGTEQDIAAGDSRANPTDDLPDATDLNPPRTAPHIQVGDSTWCAKTAAERRYTPTRSASGTDERRRGSGFRRCGCTTCGAASPLRCSNAACTRTSSPRCSVTVTRRSRCGSTSTSCRT